MRVRRHVSHSVNWLGWLPRPSGGRFGAAVFVATFVGALLVGYAVAVFVLFPAPIFTSSRNVPRLIGMSADDARGALASAGLKLETVESVRHPSAPSGRVVWQDPPAGVVVPEGTGVQLSVSTGPQRIPVPDVVGYDGEIARTLLDAAGLKIGSVDSEQTSASKGVVVNTRPPAGVALVPGARVTLVVSAGAPTIGVPDLRGLTLDEARTILEQAGLTLGTYFRRTAPESPGTIIEQRPLAGTLSAPGGTVDVILARRGSG